MQKCVFASVFGSLTVSKNDKAELENETNVTGETREGSSLRINI